MFIFGQVTVSPCIPVDLPNVHCFVGLCTYLHAVLYFPDDCWCISPKPSTVVNDICKIIRDRFCNYCVITARLTVLDIRL